MKNKELILYKKSQPIKIPEPTLKLCVTKE